MKVPRKNTSWLLRFILGKFGSGTFIEFHCIRTRNGDACTAALREQFGDAFVGLCGISERKAPAKPKAKWSRKQESGSSEEDSDHTSGNIESVLIEARQAGTGHPYYLCTWQGYFPIDCNWVKQKDMSKDAGSWWSLERESVYPGFVDEDFPIYDTKANTLRVGRSTEKFLTTLPHELLIAAGVPPVPGNKTLAAHLAAEVSQVGFPVDKLIAVIVANGPK